MKINVPEQEEKEIRDGAVAGKSCTLDALKMKLSMADDMVMFVRFLNHTCKLGVVTEDGKKIYWFENETFDGLDDLFFNAEVGGIPMYNYQYAELIKTYTV